MTKEEAKAIYVAAGMANGWTLKPVFERQDKD